MRKTAAEDRAARRSRAIRGVAAALAAGAAVLLGLALRPEMEQPAYAGATPAAQQAATEALDYASPLEILLSPDGARLYVLCQQSNEVRVLDAASYCTIRNDRRGPRSARHGAFARGRPAICHELLG